MKIIIGDDIGIEWFEKLCKFDIEIFAKSDDFYGDATIAPEATMAILKKNRKFLAIVVDGKEEIVGYIQGFPLERNFQEKYMCGQEIFLHIDETKILDPTQKEIDLYMWGIAIHPKYCGKNSLKFSDANNQEISVLQILIEAFIDAIAITKKEGIIIDHIYAEAISKKGFILAQSLCGEDALIHIDNEKNYYLFFSKFNPRSKFFARCKNVQKLLDAYCVNENNI